MVPGLRVGGGLGSVAVPWLPPSVSWHAADARRPVHVGNAAGRRACEGRTAAQFQGQTYFGYPNRTGLAAFWVPDPNGALTTIFVQRPRRRPIRSPDNHRIRLPLLHQ